MIDKKISATGLLLVYRIVLLLWILKVFIDPFYRLAELPVEIWHPIGALEFVDVDLIGWLWRTEALWSLKIATLTSLIIAFLRYGGRWIGIIAAVLVTVQQSIIRGLGDVNHSDIALLLVFYVLVSAPIHKWRNDSECAHRDEPKSILRAMGWVLVGPYCMIAAYRLIYGGPGVFDPSSMSSWLIQLSLRPTWFGFEFGSTIAANALLVQLSTIGFVVVTILEVLSPLCMAYRKFRLVWVTIMLPFHFFTLPLMNIFFWENLILITLLFTPVLSWLVPSAVDNVTPETE